MDQETWELVEMLFPWRAEALREAMKSLAEAVQAAANPPKIGDFWEETEELDKKGAGLGVRTASASDEVSTIVEGHSSSQRDDLTLGGRASSPIGVGTMQIEKHICALEEALQHHPSYVARFREGRSSFEAEACQLAHTFCGICGFWVDGPHQCPPVQAQSAVHRDNVQPASQRVTAFCQTCPDPDEVTQALQELGFHLVFSMAAEESGDYMGLPPLPAQFHYEDEVGTRVEFLAGEDIPCLTEEADEDATCGLPVCYPPHGSRYWLTTGGQELAMRRTRESLAKWWALHWLDQRDLETMEEAA